MRILIVAATEPEIAPLVATFGGARALQASDGSTHDVVVLTTGVGMVATAARTARALADMRYDLALNLGVCGSFDPALTPGTVVHVVADRLAELGAEDDEAFLTIAQLGLEGEDAFVNASPPKNGALTRLPAVSGITVNTVHGNTRSIEAVVARFRPQVESMEGAAFMYACLIHKVAFAQVRAVSNVVEKRNQAGWELDAAIGNLGRIALQILEGA